MDEKKRINDWTKDEQEIIKKIVKYSGVWNNKDKIGFYAACSIIRPKIRWDDVYPTSGNFTDYEYKIKDCEISVDEDSDYSEVKNKLGWVRSLSLALKGETYAGFGKEFSELLENNTELVRKVLSNLEENEKNTLELMTNAAESYLRMANRFDNECTQSVGQCGSCYEIKKSIYQEILSDMDLPEELKIRTGTHLINYFAWSISGTVGKPYHHQRINDLSKLIQNEMIPTKLKESAKNKMKEHFESMARNYI
jgi:hypothetical protein